MKKYLLAVMIASFASSCHSETQNETQLPYNTWFQGYVYLMHIDDECPERPAFIFLFEPGPLGPIRRAEGWTNNIPDSLKSSGKILDVQFMLPSSDHLSVCKPGGYSVYKLKDIKQH